MLTVAQIESAILDRLKAQIAGIEIDAYPDQPETYQLKHPAGAVLIRYARSHFDKHEPTDVVIQDQILAMECVVLVRNLHKLGDHAGLLNLLTTVRQALTGYQIPGAQKAYPITEEFVDYERGVWQYVITFEIKTIHTEPPGARGLIEFIEGVGYADDQPAL